MLVQNPFQNSCPELQKDREEFLFVRFLSTTTCKSRSNIVVSDKYRDRSLFCRIEQLKALLEESTTSESNSEESGGNSNEEEQRKTHKRSKAKHKRRLKKKHRHKHRKLSKDADDDSDSDSRKRRSREKRKDRWHWFVWWIFQRKGRKQMRHSGDVYSGEKKGRRNLRQSWEARLTGRLRNLSTDRWQLRCTEEATLYADICT